MQLFDKKDLIKWITKPFCNISIPALKFQKNVLSLLPSRVQELTQFHEFIMPSNCAIINGLIT